MKELSFEEKPSTYDNIYNNSKRESICSRSNRRHAEILINFMNQEFTLARDYGIKLKENVDKKYESKWLFTMPEEAIKYSKSVDDMITGMNDFWSGWTACKKYFEIKESE